MSLPRFKHATPDHLLRAQLRRAVGNPRDICRSLNAHREPPPRGYSRWDEESLKAFLASEPEEDA
jgi:hypothetical protein